MGRGVAEKERLAFAVLLSDPQVRNAATERAIQLFKGNIEVGDGN